MRLSVLSPPEGWHFRDLDRAAKEIGIEGKCQIEVSHFEFGSLAGGLTSQTRDFNIDADMVFVRTMPAGSLEQVVFRMDLLQQLMVSGTQVVNSPKCVEASVDKYLCLALLSAAGLPIPDTQVSQTVDQALKDFIDLGSDVVVKPIFGSMGNGILRLKNRYAASVHFQSLIEMGQVVYQQRFIDHGGTDLRLLVIGDQVWGMRRTNHQDWITNISRGGTGSAHQPMQQEIELAVRACQAVGAKIAGVDIVYDGAVPRILEVNAAVGWKEISRVLETDFGRLILLHLARELAT